MSEQILGTEHADTTAILNPSSIDLQNIKRRALEDISVVLWVTGTGASALLTGDLEPIGWQYLKDQNHDLKSDVLKFPYHGGACHLSGNPVRAIAS